MFCAVFITSNDLINWVDYDGNVVFLCCSTDQLWCQLIHRHGFASQVPNVQICNICWCPVVRLVYVLEPMHGARSVQFQVDIQHRTLRHLPPPPLQPLCYSNTQLDESKRFAGLRRASQLHFMSLSQYAVNEGWR